MKKFFQLHREWLLAALGLLFAVLLLGFFLWYLSVLAVILNDAVSSPGAAAPAVQFDLEGARSLNILPDQGNIAE